MVSMKYIQSKTNNAYLNNIEIPFMKPKRWTMVSMNNIQDKSKYCFPEPHCNTIYETQEVNNGHNETHFFQRIYDKAQINRWRKG